MSKREVGENTTSMASSPPDEAARSDPEESTADFSLEWCQELLSDPSYQHTSSGSRRLGGTHGPSFSSLMGKTLFTSNTLRAIRSLYKPSASAYDGSLHAEGKKFGGEVLALISLGDEMCSHATVLHGGINTTLIDEVGGDLASREIHDDLMAVNFNVNLRKAVRTPGVVLVRAWMERQPEGRKIWVKCRIEQDGVTCIESESLYLKVNLTGKL